jgi:integrase
MTKMLTAAAADKIKPDPLKRKWVKDGAMPSLYLVVHPARGREDPPRTFVMRFRGRAGAIQKITLGPFVRPAKPKKPAKTAPGSASRIDEAEVQGEPVVGSPLTLAAARQLATRILRERAMGVDVAGVARAAKRQQLAGAADAEAQSFARLASDYVEHMRKQNLRAWRRSARNLGLEFAPDGEPVPVPGGLVDRWGARPAGEIGDADCWAAVEEARKIGTPGLARTHDGPSDSRARLFRAALSALFRWAQRSRRVPTNPVAAVAAPRPSRSRDRVLGDHEIRWFWRSCAELAPPVGQCLRVLLLTGQRLNEVASMRKAELVEGGAVLDLPASRTKNGLRHVVPLPALAQEIVAEVARVEGDYVFTATGRAPIAQWSRTKRQIDALMLARAREEDPRAEIPHWTFHDLRRTCATGMAKLRVATEVREAVLNHASGEARRGVAGTYNLYGYLAEKGEALARWAQHVVGVVSDERPSKVVPIKRGA